MIYTLSEIFTRIVTSSFLINSSFFNGVYIWMYFRIKSVLEREERKYFRRTVKLGATVLDIGANIGFFTIEFSRLVGPEGTVHAFEPDPFIFSLLKKNIERSNCTNVVLHNTAVSEKSGQISFFVNAKNRADNRAYASPDDHRRQIVVASKPIDEVIPQHASVDFIKMDIQGYELFALKGMKSTIARSKECVLFTEFWPSGMKMCGYESEEYLRELWANHFMIETEESSTQITEHNAASFIQKFPMNDFGYTNLVCIKH